jgi:hypothetical protein
LRLQATGIDPQHFAKGRLGIRKPAGMQLGHAMLEQKFELVVHGKAFHA